MNEAPFLVPDDFRAFMKRVVAYLDAPGEDKFLDAEDALQDETGYGGRVDHEQYRFTYITPDGLYKWELPIADSAIREIADGLLIEVMGERRDIVRTKHRQPVGEPLLVWGEYRDDALSVTSEAQFLAALDGLQVASYEAPRMLRLWSATDDQCVAVIKGDACALYVVESLDGYGTSTGDRTRTESFGVSDYDGKPFLVPWADCIPWAVARAGLAHFMQHGELGSAISIDGRIPSVLLMMGDVDRKTALTIRGNAPSELAGSSLPRLSASIPAELVTIDERTSPVEVGAPLTFEALRAWARRLIEALYARSLIELGIGNMDEVAYDLAGLLQAHGTEAEHSLDTAEWLANEIGAVRGIARMFATGGDLQIALRRSREA